MVLTKYEHSLNEPPLPPPPPPPPTSPLQPLSHNSPLLLTKYPTHTPNLHHSDDYFKTRKKISPFKGMSPTSSSSSSSSSPSMISSLFNRVVVVSPHLIISNKFSNFICTKYVKILFKYFLFLFMSMFLVLFMVQAYKCVHKYNLNQRDVTESLNALKHNYRHLRTLTNNNHSSHLNEQVSIEVYHENGIKLKTR
jgi:hypothetical protein